MHAVVSQVNSCATGLFQHYSAVTKESGPFESPIFIFERVCVYLHTSVFFGIRYRVYNFSSKYPNFQVPI